MDKITIIIYTYNQRLFQVLFSRLTFLGFKPWNVFWSCNSSWSILYEKPNLIILDEDFLIGENRYFSTLLTTVSSNIPVLYVLNKNFPSSLLDREFNEFLIKPFSFIHFDNKVSKLLNGFEGYLNNSYTYSSTQVFLEINTNKPSLKLNSVPIHLTKIESQVLSFLLQLPQQQASKALLLNNIWGYNDIWSIKSNILEMQISKLKSKLSPFFIGLSVLIKKRSKFLLFS